MVLIYLLPIYLPTVNFLKIQNKCLVMILISCLFKWKSFFPSYEIYCTNKIIIYKMIVLHKIQNKTCYLF